VEDLISSQTSEFNLLTVISQDQEHGLSEEFGLTGAVVCEMERVVNVANVHVMSYLCQEHGFDEGLPGLLLLKKFNKQSSLMCDEAAIKSILTPKALSLT
jgi:hypothetical protein